MLGTTMKKNSAILFRPIKLHCNEKDLSPEKSDVLRQATERCRLLSQNHGMCSVIVMESAGFHYTNNGDTVRCDTCELEVSGWTVHMNPFRIHEQRNPQCSFVRSIRCGETNFLPSSITHIHPSTDEVPLRQQNIELTQENNQINILIETHAMKQIRKRTFSHWPHRTAPSSAQMIEAGFFNCNVGDRVICIYCNLICQQWIPNTDDPWKVHQTLSPKCSYVIAALKHQQLDMIPTIDEHSADEFRCDEVIYTSPCHAEYADIFSRRSSFVTWSNENPRVVDDLVRAGFFYTGIKTTVKCFYCNGSLDNFKANDNPTVEHARWFPNCAYIKQQCDGELYQRIQKSNRVRPECHKPYNKKILKNLVQARLDLPISKYLHAEGLDLSIIEKCYENQLRLTHDDFATDADLRMAYIIHQKQIEHIDG